MQSCDLTMKHLFNSKVRVPFSVWYIRKVHIFAKLVELCYLAETFQGNTRLKIAQNFAARTRI